MQANEAIERLRAALIDCLKEITCLQPHGTNFKSVAILGEIEGLIAATATIDPPAAGQLKAKSSIFADAPKVGEVVRVRIKRGAVVFQDHRSMVWPNCLAPRGVKVDPEMDFDGVWKGSNWDCSAHGFGKSGKDSYGCGSIFVHKAHDVHVVDPASEASAPVPRMGGNTSGQTVIREIRATAAQPAADHAKRAEGEREAFESWWDGWRLAEWRATLTTDELDMPMPDGWARGLMRHAWNGWQARGQQAGAAIPGEAK